MSYQDRGPAGLSGSKPSRPSSFRPRDTVLSEPFTSPSPQPLHALHTDTVTTANTSFGASGVVEGSPVPMNGPSLGSGQSRAPSASSTANMPAAVYTARSTSSSQRGAFAPTRPGSTSADLTPTETEVGVEGANAMFGSGTGGLGSYSGSGPGSGSTRRWRYPFEDLTLTERAKRTVRRLHKSFWFPMGITGERSKKALGFIGRLGWLCKGLLYATIGAMAIAGAFHTGEAEGPMGVLILLGGGDFSLARLPVLIFLVVGTASYVIWRFWEGLLGQGSDATYSRFRNLFKYRVAPLVSGSIYVVYIWYLIEIIQKAQAYNDEEESASTCAPGCWHDTPRGRFLLFWAGAAFALAAMMQIGPAWRASFMAEFPPLARWKARLVRCTGRLGYFGRAAAFLAVSALFFQNLRDRTDTHRDPFADALRSLQSSWGGQLLLTSIGLALVFYGAHCLTVMFFRKFPTEPPSSIPAGMTWFGLGPSSPSAGPGLTDLLADPTPEGAPGPLAANEEGRRLTVAVY